MNIQRLFGLLGMMGSPLFLLYVLSSGADKVTLLGSTLGLLFQFGCLCSIIGLFLARATGDSLISRGILVLQMVLHTLAMLFQVLEYQQSAQDSTLFMITDIAWPLGFLFMLVTGGAVIRAPRWLGWRRYLPLLCAFPLPLAILSGGLLGQEAVRFIFGFGLLATYLWLGYAVFSYSADETSVMATQPSF